MPQSTALAQSNSSSNDIKDLSQSQGPLKTPNNDPFKEYVSGSPLTYLQNYYNALPQYIDDITADFNLEVYDQMLKDSQVTSAFESLRMGVLSSGINFPGRVQDEKDPDFALSEEVRQFVERNLMERLAQPFRQICYDLLEGMAFGHKVAEMTFENVTDTTDEDNGKTCLKSLKVKPQRVTAFVVDAYYNVVAIAGRIPGQVGNMLIPQGFIPVSQNGTTPTVSLLPRSKFCIFTYRPQDADPRGTSILRPAYDPWWRKQQFRKDHLAYMSAFASPSIVGFTPEDSVAYPVSDSYANPTPDGTGTQQYLTPEQLYATAIAGLKNNSYMVVPGGSKIEVLQPQGNGEAFDKAFDRCDSEITKGIQYQTLSTNEGQHQSRAASQTHENVKDMVINFAKEALADCINRDVIYTLVRYNYTEDEARKFAPKIDFSEAAASDFATDATAVAALQTAGYLHISQYQGIDTKLNLPPRDLEAQLADMEAEKQQQADQQQQQLEIAKAKVAQPQPNPAPGQQPAENKGNQPQGKANMSAEFDHWITVGEGEDATHVLIKGGGESSGSSKSKEPEKKTAHDHVSDIEKKIYNKPLEEAHIYSPDGKEHSVFPGDENHFEIQGKDVDRLKNTDAILTHNHPSGGKYENGITLSLQDAKLAYQLNLKEMRAVSANAQGGITTFVMERPERGWNSPHTLNKVWKETSAKLSIEYHAKHPNRDVSFMTFLDGGDRLWQDIQMRLPAHMKIKYSRTNSKG